MPQRCCVPMCNTSGGHRFPKDPVRKKQWLKAVCRDSLCPDSARVCRGHFLPEDYVGNYLETGYSYLKKDAVPSVFVWSANKIFEDKKEGWRKETVIYGKKGVKPHSQGNSEVSKDNMNNINEEDWKRSETKEVENKSIADHDEIITGDLNFDAKRDDNQISECRACLQQLRVDRLYSLFHGWAPSWHALGSTIAEDLSNISNIQLSKSDIHSKFICHTCCDKLWNACQFKMLVEDNDRILRQRISDDSEKVWPKPIQVEKSINGVYENIMPFDVDIKQEVLSDEEAGNMDDGYTDGPLMEIKVEPEEIVEQPRIMVNGVRSLKEFPSEDFSTPVLNGETKTDVELLKVKTEPLSDNEDAVLPLDCLLCTRSFHSVSGLKAHVIAQHSYQTVGRREVSPHRTSDKYVCATCRRTFTTSTDLMVHETCHNKHVCYGCGGKYDSFASLSAHRGRCKPPAQPKRPRTLDDVMRPLVEDNQRKEENSREVNTVTNRITIEDGSKLFSCPHCNEIFSDMYYVKIHQEVHHSKEVDQKTDAEPSPMEIEMLESIFNEET